MNNQNGHTLIELIFVMVISGLAFPALLAFFTNNVVDSIKNEVICKAIVLAQSKMEEVIADKQNAERGFAYIKYPNRYPEETIEQFKCSVSIRNNSVEGISGLDVQVSVGHALLESNYTLSHFFTKQDVY